MKNFLSTTPLADVLLVEPQPDYSATVDDVAVECYEKGMPWYIETELHRLYRSIYSSLVQFRIHGGAEDSSVYLARDKGRISSVLLYRRENRRVTVINQCIALDGQEISRFARYIFSRFPDVHVISFNVIEPQAGRIAYPLQRFKCKEDIVLPLPSSVDTYHSHLGKSTRSYISRYLNKLKRDFPSFSFEVHSGDDVAERDVIEVFEMNRLRMAERGLVYGFSEDYPERTVRLLRESGFLGLVRIQGEICAGAIIYAAGDEYYLEVVSHKSEYNDYGLGTLCCYLSICECIRRDGKVYHFLWGRYDYKFRLGGMIRDLYDLTIYRSTLQYILNADIAFKTALHGRTYQLKSWLHTVASKDSMAARLLHKAAQWMRSVKCWRAMLQNR